MWGRWFLSGQVGSLVGRDVRLAQRRKTWDRRFLIALGEREPRIAQRDRDVFGDRERRRQPGRADAAHTHIALIGVHTYLEVAMLGRGPYARIHRRPLFVLDPRGDATTCGPERGP